MKPQKNIGNMQPKNNSKTIGNIHINNEAKLLVIPVQSSKEEKTKRNVLPNESKMNVYGMDTL